MKLWKTLLCILALFSVSPLFCSSRQDGISLVFWNCENFFDYRNDGTGESDEEYSSYGEKHWTSSRFYAKCALFAKTIFIMADKYGKLPDIVALAEIENKFVLKSLIGSSLLRKLDYRIVHYDSPDHRGIDCALLYRSSRLTLCASRPCRIDSLQTRDILLAQFLLPDGDSLAVLVNHHPSKYGGVQSADKRSAALSRLRAVSDSLNLELWREQLAIGDFNESADNSIFDVLEPSLVPLMPEYAEVPGTIRFNGKWELIDLAFASAALARRSKCRICVLPHLLEWDASHSGMRPKRTYTGPRYKGGFSDHLPIRVDICRRE